MEDVLMEALKDRIDEKVNTRERKTIVTYICNIMESFDVTIEKAMVSLKIPQTQRETYARIVKERI